MSQVTTRVVVTPDLSPAAEDLCERRNGAMNHRVVGTVPSDVTLFTLTRRELIAP